MRLALFALLIAAAPVTAQVRQPVTLRGFGNPAAGPAVGPTQLVLQAAQIEFALTDLRAACNTLNLPPAARLPINLAVNRMTQAVQAFRVIVGSGANPARVLTAHAQMDAVLDECSQFVETSAGGSVTVGQALGRLRFADDRLHALLGVNGTAGGNNGRVVARLASSLEESVGELRAAIHDAGGVDRPLSRQLLRLGLEGRRVAALAGGNATAQQLAAEVAPAVAAWQSVTPAVAAIAARSVAVRLQAARVGQLVTGLSQAVGGAGVDPGFVVVGPRSRAFVIGAGEGGGPHVRVLHQLDGPSSDFFAYDPGFRGGVRVALADLNGDGVPDIVTAPGPGMEALIRVFDGRTLNLLTEFVAYDAPFDIGVNVAAADLTPQGQAIIAVGPGPGGPPHVKVFDIAAGKLLDEIFPYGRELRCGARVALADADGDGTPDLITAPGPGEGIGPQVKVFNGTSGQVLKAFNAFEEPWRGGLTVAGVKRRGNNRAEILVGTDAGGPARVRVFDPLAGRQLAELTPYGNDFRGGVRVAEFDVDGDGTPDFVTAPGPGVLDSTIRVFDGRTRRLRGEFPAFERGFHGGAFVCGCGD
jgi:hypothetical protein